MTPLGYHIRSRLEDNRVILQSTEHQRVLARVVLAQGRGDGLLAFGVPDTHLHLLTLCSRPAASGLSQRITSSLKQRLGLTVSFVTYPHQPIRDQQHLYYTLRYVLTQHVRHGLDGFSFLEATNLPDLLGMRVVGQYTRDNVQQSLPRVRMATIQEWAGLSGLQPAEGPLNAVVDATLAAAGLTGLAGRSRPVVEARAALLKVVGDRLGRMDAARLLGVTGRTVYTLRRLPADPSLTHAIRLQLGLRRILETPPVSAADRLRAGHPEGGVTPRSALIRK